AREFKVQIRQSDSKDLVDQALAASRTATYEKILDTLPASELRDVCRAIRHSDSATKRELLKTSILGSRRGRRPNDVVGELRPFFGYYGGKWRDTPKHYTAPKHDLIVEPFAGSAGYALRYYNRDVVLVERDPILVTVW